MYHAHTRTEALRINRLLSKNGAPGSEPEFVFSFASTDTSAGSSNKTFKSERDWKGPEDCFDVMDAVLNFTSLCYMIRPWSYEHIALLRSLHECR